MSAITDTQAPRRTISHASCHWNIDGAVRRKLAGCSYNVVFDKISWKFDDGTLTLQGYVPSFYLKQVLQELLLGIGEIDRIQNDVAVVSSTGLSCDTNKKAR